MIDEIRLNCSVIAEYIIWLPILTVIRVMLASRVLLNNKRTYLVFHQIALQSSEHRPPVDDVDHLMPEEVDDV